jgi:hypothetical protein
VFFAAARVTTGHAVSVLIDILRRPFGCLPVCQQSAHYSFDGHKRVSRY